MNEPPSTEFEERIHKLLGSPDADPAFTESLRLKLNEGIKEKPARRFSPRLAWGLAIVLILLALGLLAFSPKVVEAMKHLLGYIPGVGYVDQGTVQVLAGPATMQKDGLTITVDKGAADTQSTVLLAEVDGYTADPLRDPNSPQSCTDMPRLVTADGTVLESGRIESESGRDNSTTVFVRYEFQPMPAGQSQAALEIPCLLFDSRYRDWRIPLNFQPAADTQDVASVIELPTPVPSPAAPTAVPAQLDESVQGFSILLKTEAELSDGYVLSGNYQWDDERYDNTTLNLLYFNILDANGADVPFQEVNPDPSVNAGPREIPFAYQITGKEFAWPLKLVVYTLSATQPGGGTFQFDPGPDPQIGQTWDVSIDVPVGSHIIHVQTIQLTDGRAPGMAGYDFTMTSDKSVASASVVDINPVIHCSSDCLGGGGGGGGGGQDAGVSGFLEAQSPFSYGSVAQGYDPSGLKTFAVSDVAIIVKGPWEVSWQPSK